ncbi:hypothetical protein HPB50_005586 [Hyalomma asiaticum]|uniref:Uncharacterized protein n=1 Tax=Hyalomma asiaticum TaxID=266040 RepID=A0ACB7TCW9_HYAAI|nr:hypothetical protein HPB50_005586 [Hyalomma asiaticum]
MKWRPRGVDKRTLSLHAPLPRLLTLSWWWSAGCPLSYGVGQRTWDFSQASPWALPLGCLSFSLGVKAARVALALRRCQEEEERALVSEEGLAALDALRWRLVMKSALDSRAVAVAVDDCTLLCSRGNTNLCRCVSSTCAAVVRECRVQ